MARKDMSRYHRKGPDGTTRALFNLIRDTGISEVSLLDIGAGIGVLHHELMPQIVATATHVEASPSYIAEARREAEERSHAGNVRFIEGDATELADAVPGADLVTLDRVICCYPDWDRLLTHSAPKARRYYGLSIPQRRWAVRLFVAFQNMRRVCEAPHSGPTYTARMPSTEGWASWASGGNRCGTRSSGTPRST